MQLIDPDNDPGEENNGAENDKGERREEKIPLSGLFLDFLNATDAAPLLLLTAAETHF